MPPAQLIDQRLHRERLVARTRERRLHAAPWPGLPDGTFVLFDGAPAVLVGRHLVGWTPDDGYRARRRRPLRGDASVVTPPATVAVLRAGYRPQIDPSA